MDEDRQQILKTSSSSGEISAAFVNVSDVFTQYAEIPTSGFNTLYKAQRFGKWFVLKGLKEEYRDSAVHRELLSKEFALGILLSHENIVRYYNKETDPVVGDCIVMEFVDGETLSEFMKSSPSQAVCERIALQLLRAMAYYQSLQIVHRDLKPDNILITRNGNNVKIIDFGLSDADFSTVLKQPAGSPKYMAPEQSKEGIEIDARADLYAFALIVRNLWPKMPYAWRQVVRGCAQYERENRPANAEVAMQLLARLQKRRIVLLSLGALSFALLVVAALFQWVVRPYFEKKTGPAKIIVEKSVQNVMGDSLQSQPSTKDTVVLYKDKAELTNEMKQFLEQQAKNYFQPFWEVYHKHDERINQLLAGVGGDAQQDLEMYRELLSIYDELWTNHVATVDTKIIPALKRKFPEAQYVEQFAITSAYYKASDVMSNEGTMALASIYSAIDQYDKCF